MLTQATLASGYVFNARWVGISPFDHSPLSPEGGQEIKAASIPSSTTINSLVVKRQGVVIAGLGGEAGVVALQIYVVSFP